MTILAIAAIILAAAGSVGAAAPEEPRELTVLAYNTHLFEDSSADCLCDCAKYWYDTTFGLKGWNCIWGDYVFEDDTRREAIALMVEDSGADIVVLQEVWAPSWWQWFVDRLEPNYPYAEFLPSNISCDVVIGSPCNGKGFCDTDLLPTLGSGMVLLSKLPLDNVKFKRFPTFTQCDMGGCEAWSDKGVLTADVNVGGITIRVGVSHARQEQVG
jgi:hypothetical protein